MLWESHSFRSDTTILKIAAHQWIMSHGLASLQAEKTKSLPKWTMWWCGTVVWLSERLWKRWTSALFRHISILTEDLAMKRVAVKFVPKLLMAEQKQLCVEVSQDMLDSTNSWYGSLWFLAVPQSHEAIERKVISGKRGHYYCNVSWAKYHSKKAFSECF